MQSPARRIPLHFSPKGYTIIPKGPNYIVKQIMHPEDAYKEANSTKAATEEIDPERANQGEKEYKVAKGNYGPRQGHSRTKKEGCPRSTPEGHLHLLQIPAGGAHGAVYVLHPWPAVTEADAAANPQAVGR